MCRVLRRPRPRSVARLPRGLCYTITDDQCRALLSVTWTLQLGAVAFASVLLDASSYRLQRRIDAIRAA